MHTGKHDCSTRQTLEAVLQRAVQADRCSQWLRPRTGERIAQTGTRHWREYELCTNIKHYVHIDDDFFRGKKVLVIDDIYTTGQSSSAFIGAMQAAGADVLGALFLGRTKRFCSRR